jgi:hypothetical protein
MSFTNDPRPRQRTSAGVTRNTGHRPIPSVGAQALIAIIRAAMRGQGIVGTKNRSKR